MHPLITAGPAERFLKWGCLKKLERSERSANRRGVQGPAIGPLVGSRGNTPGGGPGGGAPGSSEVLDIWIQSDKPILRPFCNALRPYINLELTEIIVGVYPKYQNITD